MKIAAKQARDKEVWVAAGLAVLIFLLNIRNIGILDGPFMFNDELGYLGNAAALAGKDWHEIMQFSSWYGYGWSIVMAPLFLLFSSMGVIYRCVNVINALLLVAVFLMQRYLLRKVFPDSGRYFVTAVAACVSCYHAFLVHSNIAWCEVWLLFLFTLLTLLLYRFIQTPRPWRAFLLGFLLYYLYVSHNRMLGVLLAGILVFAVLVFCRVADKKSAALFVLALVLAFFLFGALKSYIVSMNWRAGLPSGNDMGSGLGKLSELFRFEVLRNFLSVLVTQLLYISISSYGLFPFGLFVCLRKLIQAVRRKQLKDAVLELWLILSFLGMLAISATMFGAAEDLSVGRGVDHIFYGRYFETVCLLPMAIGFLCLSHWGQDRANRLYGALYPCAIALSTALAYKIVSELVSPTFNWANISGLGIYYQTLGKSATFIFAAALFGLVGMGLLVSLSQAGKPVFQYIGLICFFAAGIASMLVTQQSVTASQKRYTYEAPLIDSILAYDTGETPICVVGNTTPWPYYQCAMVDIPLRFSPNKPLAEVQEDTFYAITSKKDYYRQGFDVHSEIIENNTDNLFLFVDRSDGRKDDTLEIPLDQMSLRDCSRFGADAIQVEATSGKLAFYGPYINLEPGDYVWHVDLAVHNGEDAENYGTLQLNSPSKDTALGKITLAKEMLADGQGQVDLPFTLDERANAVELYLTTAPGVAYDVYGLSLTRLPASE